MQDPRLSLLRDLERALLEAISESAEVHRTLERMHEQGFTLQVYLDCRPTATAAAQPSPGSPSSPSSASSASSDGALEPVRVPAQVPAISARAAGRSSERRPRAARKPATPEPPFRINTDDLAMLRALGIDPTRKGRARR
jgi:hypothetical protein